MKTRVAVKTRFRTMSGWPGGRVRYLEPAEARDAIARGWADPVSVDVPISKKMTATK